MSTPDVNIIQTEAKTSSPLSVQTEIQVPLPQVASAPIQNIKKTESPQSVNPSINEEDNIIISHGHVF